MCFGSFVPKNVLELLVLYFNKKEILKFLIYCENIKIDTRMLEPHGHCISADEKMHQ